jgi:hypothetical protein
MQTTLKATLVGIGGIAVGALIGIYGVALALPDDAFVGIMGDSYPSSGSDSIALAGIAIGLAAVLGSLWLAAQISGQPHRLRSAVSGLAAGGLAAAVSLELPGSVSEVFYLAAPAIALAVAVRSDTPRTIVTRIVAVLAASALVLAGSMGANIVYGMIVVAFAIPLSDAATHQYSTATR